MWKKEACIFASWLAEVRRLLDTANSSLKYTML